jgi:hypothetical protein
MHRFRPRALAATLLVTLAAAGSAAPTFALIPQPKQTLTIDAPVLGAAKPYKLHLFAQNLGASGTLELKLSRRATTGTHDLQTHDFYIQHVSLSCSANLASCYLDTGGHMGSFGRIHLHFSATYPAQTTALQCAQDYFNGDRTTRRGTVSGTFRLVTGTAFFGTIRNGASGVHLPATFGAQAAKVHYSNTPCPPRNSCPPEIVLQGVTPDGTSVIGTRNMRSGKGSIYYQHPDAAVMPDVSVRHSIEAGTAHGSFINLVSNAPKLQKLSMDLAGFGPWLSGKAVFTGGAPATVSGTTCLDTQRYGISFTATVVAHFDGYGTVPWTTTTTSLAYRLTHAPYV